MLRTLVFGVDLPGYASLIVAVLFLGGIQLIGIGVLGEYGGSTSMSNGVRTISFGRASGLRAVALSSTLLAVSRVEKSHRLLKCPLIHARCGVGEGWMNQNNGL